MNKDRYAIDYIDSKGNWQNLTAKTIKEAEILYNMVDDDCQFKTCYDIITGDVHMQEG